MWIHTMIVAAGRAAQFPMDMLRYDRAWPYGPDDAARIAVAGTAPFGDEPYAIKVGRYSATMANGFTAARWSSFGWVCSAPEVRKMR